MGTKTSADVKLSTLQAREISTHPASHHPKYPTTQHHQERITNKNISKCAGDSRNL